MENWMSVQGGGIHGHYSYLEIIGFPTTLTTSGQRSHHVGPSYSIKNDTTTLQTVFLATHIRQNNICKGCGRIGHKSDD